GDDQGAKRSADQAGDERPPLPVWDARPRHLGDPAGLEEDGGLAMTQLADIQSRHFSRRAFLKGGGAVVVAFGAPLTLSTAADGDAVPYPDVDASLLDSWLSVGADGKVTLFTGRVDSGQHKETSFGQIVAEELDV